MTDARQTPEEQLLKHYREQHTGEPSEQLDALILAAARRAAPAPKPSLWQRWLQACQRPRWQMAFATVAGVALMIGLVLRSPVPHEELSAPASMEFSADRQAPAGGGLAGEDFVGDGAGPGGELLYAERFVEDPYGIAFLCFGDVGDVEHAHIHAYIAHNRRGFAMHQHMSNAITNAARQAIGVT